MECTSFSDLLPKLREAHEREVDGWQAKVHELSNKKGSDTKRMEELFNRNQQMKEHQRLLTENIKTLENRLRAGLCDRCTVTQEVAKRRQQEFELSQMQSLQHITMLAGEVSSLKKENKRLRDELKAALEKGKSRHSPISNITITEVKQVSPDPSPSCNPLALMAQTASWATGQPADGNVVVKTEVEQKTEVFDQTEVKNGNRQLRGVINHFEVCQPVSITTPPSWKAEHSAVSVGDRRSQSMEGPDQRSSIPAQALPFKNSSSSASGEANPSRHVLHAPVPCRPQPIKSSPVTLPWPLSESSDWLSVAAAGIPMQPSPKHNRLRFPNLIPTSQHASHSSSRRQGSGSQWHKQSKSQPHAKEPTVVFRLRDMSENVGSQTKPKEKKEIPPSEAEGISGERLRVTCDGPLDLSDRGKSKSGQTPRDDSPLVREILQMSPDNVKTKPPPPYVPLSSPSPAATRSTSSTSPVRQTEKEPSNDRNHKVTGHGTMILPQQVISKQEKKGEVNGKTDQNNGKKVPVLTISLRPVVVLEALNSALQKQESLSANGKKLTPAAESGSSSYEQDEEEDESEQESNRGYKRKRASVETETDRDSDTNNIHPGGRSRSQ